MVLLKNANGVLPLKAGMQDRRSRADGRAGAVAAGQLQRAAARRQSSRWLGSRSALRRREIAYAQGSTSGGWLCHADRAHGIASCQRLRRRTDG